MKMKKIISAALSLFLFLAAYSQVDNLSLRKRVAVLDMSDKSGWKEGNAGSAVTTMLITELAKTNKFQVIEKEMLQGVIDPANGEISIQRLNQQGVQLIVTGGVTEYGMKTDTKKEYYVYFSQSKSKQFARVAVDLRLINTANGEIILAEKAIAEKTSESKSSGLGAFGMYGGNSQDNTLLDIAKREAVEKCVAFINQGISKIQWEGSVIKVNDDGTLFMKPGSIGGIKTNMKFAVYSKGQELIDPETGLNLGSSEKYLGVIQVIEDLSGGKACKASILSGEGYKAGDIVRVN